MYENILNFTVTTSYQLNAKNMIIEQFVNHKTIMTNGKKFRKYKLKGHDDEYMHLNLTTAKYLLASFKYQKITDANKVPYKPILKLVNKSIIDILLDESGWSLITKSSGRHYLYYNDRHIEGDELVQMIIQVLHRNTEKVKLLTKSSPFYRIFNPEYKPIDDKWIHVYGYHEFFKNENIEKSEHNTYQITFIKFLKKVMYKKNYNEIKNKYFIKFDSFIESDQRIMFNYTKDTYEYVDDSKIYAYTCNKCGIIKLIQEFPCREAQYCKSCCKYINIKHRDSVRGKLITIYNSIEHDSRCFVYTPDEPIITFEELLVQYISQGGLCAFSGAPLSFESLNEMSISKERIDNSKGYTKYNVIFVLKIFNISPGLVENADWTFEKINKLLNLRHESVDMQQLQKNVDDAKINKKGNCGKLPDELKIMKKEMGRDEWKKYYQQIYLEKYYKTFKGYIIGNVTRHYDHDKKFFGQNGTMTIEYILDLLVEQKGCCAISKVPLVFKSKSDFAMSIDRLDNKKPHDIGNVRLVCKEFNHWGDLHWTPELFEELFP
jgi:hypothetical protein